MKSRLLQGLDCCGKIGHLKDDPIPSAGLLATAAGHRARTRGARAAQDQLEIAERDLCKSRQMLSVDLEPESLCIELDRARDILDLVANASPTCDEIADFFRCG